METAQAQPPAPAVADKGEKLSDNLDPNDEFGLMTPEGLSVAFGYDAATIRNWVARREIPFIRLGRRTVFMRDSVRAWLLEKETKPLGHR